MFFFFQAEDGIRDLVRSRGLGDVYKRQGLRRGIYRDELETSAKRSQLRLAECRNRGHGSGAVSYTHLTLPTSDLV